MIEQPATGSSWSWPALIGRTLRASTIDWVSLAAAGCAFYATLARFPAIGLSMTVVAVLCAALAMSVLLLPPAIDFLGLARYGGGLIHMAGLAVLIGFFFVAVVLLYRFGPSHPPPPPRPRIKPGAALAIILWLIASELLSLYVSGIDTFGATYGALGAAISVMLWFYVSAYAVLLGAERNACLEEDADGS